MKMNPSRSCPSWSLCSVSLRLFIAPPPPRWLRPEALRVGRRRLLGDPAAGRRGPGPAGLRRLLWRRQALGGAAPGPGGAPPARRARGRRRGGRPLPLPLRVRGPAAGGSRQGGRIQRQHHRAGGLPAAPGAAPGQGLAAGVLRLWRCRGSAAVEEEKEEETRSLLSLLCSCGAVEHRVHCSRDEFLCSAQTSPPDWSVPGAERHQYFLIHFPSFCCCVFTSFNQLRVV